ncbi:23S rRNA (adenine(1618)-N(6))-methyltransferase RlmF [Permianibacter sp. IMCC34836]|uniref:23S rRNA (adenine(1618)-N(6))-methyltransferase RlmF n=1 Tax=Permianibacter fluminis TaxID=2738515 RepID=UPI001555CD0A|nr:23S rRNA (adenine(1618)-N(6))-methyltransferase RlmF [Permianibacter fluminis]
MNRRHHTAGASPGTSANRSPDLASDKASDNASARSKTTATAKPELHPRNRHRGPYDFPALISTEPALAAFVATNLYGNLTLDFANPLAVKTLNRALLRQFYQVRDWDIPAQYLCPPIPGRADYLHYLADLLARGNDGVIPRGPRVRLLDIGTGANLVYPLLGQHEYGWQFVAADIDQPALANAATILRANPGLSEHIALRWQTQPERIFAGVVERDERFDLTLCNPPFHRSLAEAQAGTERKLRGLAASAGKNAGSHRGNRKRIGASGAGNRDGDKEAPALNFGGQAAELYCPGGEAAFIKRMIRESADVSKQVLWFSTLVSKAENLPGIHRALQQLPVAEYQTVTMAQGQKQSRFVAWTFLPVAQRLAWQRTRW